MTLSTALAVATLLSYRALKEKWEENKRNKNN